MKARMRTAIVLAAAGLLAACGDDSAVVTAPTDTTVAETTTTTVVAGTTTTTVASADIRFIDDCTEYQRDGAAPGPAEANLDTFGPLAAQPGLTITLPKVQLHEPFPPRPGAVRIPGGVLVSASTEKPYPMNFGSPSSIGMMVAAIDLDGEVRWVRCFDRQGMVAETAPWTEHPTDAYLVFTEPGDETSLEAHVLDLADGTVDVEGVTLPWGVDDRPWPRVQFSFEGTVALRATAEDASVLWEDDTIVHPSREGAATLNAGDVTIVGGCDASAGLAANGRCAAEVLRGYSESDGTVLWERAGAFTLSVASDGYALVTPFSSDASANAPWTMIDARTGDDVPGQSFTGGVGFFPSCCADTHTGVFLAGGVVIAYASGVVTAWYPIDADVSPHEVALP